MPQPQQLTIKQAISRARKATKQGKTAVALELYNAVLQHKPNHPVAKQGLRKLQKGLPNDQSIPVEPTAISQDEINALINLYRSGQLIKTEQACRELLQTCPQSLIVINILGVTLQGQGRLQDAIESYDRAIQLKPDYVDAYYNRGIALKDTGQPEQAVESYEMAIRFKPDYAEAYNNRGIALKEIGQRELALESFEMAIQLKPDYAEAYNNRGNELKKLGQPDEALGSYEKAIRLRPDYAEAYNNHGNAHKDLGQLDQALESYEKAIRFRPDYAEAYSNRGVALKETGQLELALENFEIAIQLKPDYAEAHRNLSTIKKFKPDDPQIVVMESLYTEANLNKSNRIQLSFSLAKAYEDLGDYDKSFNYLVEGNCLRKKELNYNIDNDRRLIAKVREIFSAGSLFPDIVPDRNRSIQPVFILGMPRSGTSLVEQIIASHSKAHGSGELETMNKLILPILSNFPDHNIDRHKYEISQNEINIIRNRYLEALPAMRLPEKIVTDKMPLNFRWIGFILSAFPDAKIIHLNRDPRATCWSIYKQYFTVKGNGYAYDLADLAEFYRLYTDLMLFWREQFPSSIYDICYENLTENQKEETYKLLSFCDLDWEEQCLDFHKTKRVVTTASDVQVRKKMYKGSSEAWRKYEEHIQPLLKALGY